MFAGFAKNYYLRAWLGTLPIPVLVWVHGLVMTSWVLLFLAQTFLVAKRRIDLHRKLGVGGAVLATIVVGLGVATIAGSIARQHLNTSAESAALAFVAFDGISLLLFGGLVAAAIRLRFRPQVHKRLMLMAMVSLFPPALGRIVIYFTRQNAQLMVLLLMCASVGLCLLADFFQKRHRLTAAFGWSGLLVVFANLLTYLAQKTI
jgi:hypothetical protein